ncbi:FAD:protein FMN transferase [Vallitalea sp.]|jgi:thiamine biosynthesis lipoprotein|uniref:FAD:protein FMN transferase n=1 Tax=Vallitalea sp. TaxID=1882829 RepID=UPI0025E4258E|nr:FAD:protein FMN transferase [Vallitalea sp.]MCT4688000.1 FAD:protein FMN transferase [Vallitalea sp.]
MKKQIILFIVFILIVLVGCNNTITQKNKKMSDETFLLGTLVKVTIYGENVNEKDFDGIFKIISDIESKVSRNISTSEISKINNNEIEEIKLSKDTFNIIKKGLYYSKLSEGRFDITIAPLVSLWGIDTEDARVPAQKEIKEVLKKVNYKNLFLDEENLTLHIKKDTQIDLGGIAKGYIADKVSKYLKQSKMENAIINLGGNILTVGNKPNGDSWKIGVRNPFNKRGREIGVVAIGQKSLVTSGIYERYLEEDGVKYHHILDPYTGYPVENDLAGVTIISDYSVDGDGLSTVIFSMGLEEGYKLVDNINNVDAIFITKNKEVYVTKEAGKIFQLTDSNYKLKDFIDK